MSFWRLLRAAPKTVYSCGNCGQSFATSTDLAAHRDPLCPIVAIERQIAAWNRRRYNDTFQSETTGGTP